MMILHETGLRVRPQSLLPKITLEVNTAEQSPIVPHTGTAASLSHSSLPAQQAMGVSL